MSEIPAPIPADWPRRRAVARALGVSETGVRRLEDRGQLHPVRDERNARRYDPVEVEALRDSLDVGARPCNGASAGEMLHVDGASGAEGDGRQREDAVVRRVAQLEGHLAELEEQLGFALGRLHALEHLIATKIPIGPMPCTCGQVGERAVLVGHLCCGATTAHRLVAGAPLPVT